VADGGEEDHAVVLETFAVDALVEVVEAVVQARIASVGFGTAVTMIAVAVAGAFETAVAVMVAAAVVDDDDDDAAAAAEDEGEEEGAVLASEEGVAV